MDAVVERDAKLFEAGDYPDKQIAVDEADLERLEQNWSGPVPVQVEHEDTPLRLGWLTRIWRVGRELFGRISLSHHAWGLLQESGAKRLSLGLLRGDDGKVQRIYEVSVVRYPRVADAQIYRQQAAPVAFAFDIPDQGEPVPPAADAAAGATNDDNEREDNATMAESTQTYTREQVDQLLADQAAEFSEKLAALDEAGRTKLAKARAEVLLSGGTICQKQLEAACVLFAAGDDVAAAFDTFLASAAAPKPELKQESAPAAQPEADRAVFSDRDRNILQALGVSEETALKAMGR